MQACCSHLCSRADTLCLTFLHFALYPLTASLKCSNQHWLHQHCLYADMLERGFPSSASSHTPPLTPQLARHREMTWLCLMVMPPRAQVWLGYQQSLRPCESGLTLNVDLAATAFLQVQARQASGDVQYI